ncbi:IS630 transposase-related protein [Holospora obtusa]
MTKKQYSLDLRKRVIEYIKLGNTQNTTSKIFRWWIRCQEAGLT